MNIFGNGQFKIDKSWQRVGSRQSRNSSRKRSASKQNNSFVNAGKRIMQPTPDILDKNMANKIYRQFKAQMPPIPNSCKSEKKIPGSQQSSRKNLPPRQKTNQDEDLLTSMAVRMKKVEEDCQNYRKQLKEKNELVNRIQKQNIFLKGFRENSSDVYKKQEQLEKKNLLLQEKIVQMQQYLKKYGLKWVGNGKVQGELNHKKIKKDISNSKNNYRLPSQIDLATIQRRVQELNAGLHQEGQGTQIYSENGIHKMRKAQPLPMAFFSDGIAIKGFNFYSYKSKQSLKILSDLVDGYFPYVLKGKYPNGVFIKVVDMIAQKYDNQENSQKIGSMDSMAKNEFKPQSKNQFLNRLPKQVIKNGKIIPIRGEIQKKLDGIQQKAQEYSHDICKQEDGCYIIKTQVHQQVNNQQMDSNDICTLKIRGQDGKIFIIQLLSNALVKQAYYWMRKIVTRPFKIMGNYPAREYHENESENLQNLGLTPRAALHIHLL